MINISFVFDFYKIQKQRVVYVLFCQSTAKVVYVGHCRLIHLFAFPDLKQIMGNLEGNYVLQVVDSADDRLSILKKYEKAVKDFGFLKQLAEARFKKQSEWIECVNTGERWPTLHEAAAAHGVSPGNLSKHVRGVPGHVTVKGKTYKKVS